MTQSEVLYLHLLTDVWENHENLDQSSRCLGQHIMRTLYVTKAKQIMKELFILGIFVSLLYYSLYLYIFQ
jgi:hypothetical protein